MTFVLNLASCEKQHVGCAELAHSFSPTSTTVCNEGCFWEMMGRRMKRNGLSSRFWDYVVCLIPGHKFTWLLMIGEQVLFYFSWNLLEFMCYRSLLQAGWFLFLSFAFVCVKSVEYFNQYSYRNWCGLVLSDSRNSLSGQIWWWIHSYMHSGEGASASSLAWRRAWMQMGGLQTNLITSGFAWNWFPCKDTELLCASLMAFFSLLFLSLSFLSSACHEHTSADVNHIPGKCYFCWAERLFFQECWW